MLMLAANFITFRTDAHPERVCAHVFMSTQKWKPGRNSPNYLKCLSLGGSKIMSDIFTSQVIMNFPIFQQEACATTIIGKTNIIKIATSFRWSQ